MVCYYCMESKNNNRRTKVKAISIMPEDITALNTLIKEKKLLSGSAVIRELIRTEIKRMKIIV